MPAGGRRYTMRRSDRGCVDWSGTFRRRESAEVHHLPLRWFLACAVVKSMLNALGPQDKNHRRPTALSTADLDGGVSPPLMASHAGRQVVRVSDRATGACRATPIGGVLVLLVAPARSVNMFVISRLFRVARTDRPTDGRMSLMATGDAQPPHRRPATRVALSPVPGARLAARFLSTSERAVDRADRQTDVSLLCQLARRRRSSRGNRDGRPLMTRLQSRLDRYLTTMRTYVHHSRTLASSGYVKFCWMLIGPFHGAIAALSVTRCRCRRRRGHRCAGGARQYRYSDIW